MKSIFLAVLAALLIPYSAGATVRLCTGTEAGVYQSVGNDIASFLKNDEVVVVATEGTINNLDLTLNTPKDDPAACDAMIGQPDGPAYMARTSPSKVKKLREVASIHREYLIGICNKASGVDDIGDLENDPDKYKISVGAAGSGAWLIWQNIIAQDSDYGNVPTSADAGEEALAAVASGDLTCMLIASASENAIIRLADSAYGDDVVLVGANDKDFNDAVDIAGKPLYTYAKLPVLQYETTFAHYWSSISTISWNAKVFINSDRVRGKEVTDFIRAAAKASVNAKAAYGR